MKKTIVIIIFVLIALGVAYFAIFWPPESSENLKGTMAGVEKAERYKGEKLKESDIVKKNEDFNKFIQSAEWQNAVKDPEVVEFLGSDEFRLLLILNKDYQKIRLLASNYQKWCNIVLKKGDFSYDAMKVILNSSEMQNNFQAGSGLDYEKFKGIVLHNRVFFKNAFEEKDMKKSFLNLINGKEFQQKMFSKDFQELLASEDFNNYLKTKGMEKIFSSSQDFQNLIVLLNDKDFQNRVSLLSSDFNKSLFSSKIQNMINQKNFQNFITSKDFNQLHAGDFQDYLLGSLMI